MESCTHKTVFVIDHSPYFGISNEDPMEFEQTSKSPRYPSGVPYTTITKSLWTSSLEAAIEYCRIVWDIFPEGKLVRFIASDTTGHHFNTWSQSQQNITQVLNGSLTLGAPPPPVSTQRDYSVVHGLRAAIDVLTECTEEQMKRRSSSPASKVANHCRVICITSTRDDESMLSLQDIFLKCLMTQNKQILMDHHIPVHFCHLVVINIFPNNGESMVTEQIPRDLSPIVRSEVHSVRAGKQLADKLTCLILGHYDLASTTVTGIPMKEEQNASSSANYDVEIFHHSNAHTEMFKADIIDPAMVKTRKTMTLKWCTPRGNPQDTYNCSAVYRVTPVDVNSRPSSCLINFLLGGRSVLLEMPRRSGGKTNSHLLSAHGGEIFIHALMTGRSVLEDPPSISEGCGGRVTDYRVADFGAFIQANKVLPLKSRAKEIEPLGVPILRMKARLERQTRYWPITITGTFIFNLRQYIDPLPQLITKDELTAEDVTMCRQVIYNLVALESKHEALVMPSSGVRGKLPKKEEQYKQMWNELEKLVRLHCRTENHNKVLYSLLELRSKEPDKKVEVDESVREGAAVPEAVPRASVIRATTDSPMSPPPAAKSAAPVSNSSGSSRHKTIYSAPRTVMDIFLNKVAAENKTKRRPDFHGRLNGEKIAVLYPKKKTEESAELSRGDEIMVE